METVVKTVRTSALHCAYLERGPRDGVPVMLLHGFPDDAHTWDAVAPQLAADGWRTIAPFVRGFGATRVVAPAARSGETAALGRDVLDLADALGIERFHIVGHDWGARAAYAAAILAPARVRSLTTLAVAYGTNVAGQQLDAAQLRGYWYQWYLATPRGERALRESRAAFCRDLWTLWSPGWRFTDEEYARTAASFENPDFVEVVLHSYRVRWGFVPPDPDYAADAAAFDRLPRIDVPTTTLMGRDDGATMASSAIGKERLFGGPYALDVLDGCGHFIPRERPQTVVEAIIATKGR